MHYLGVLILWFQNVISRKTLYAGNGITGHHCTSVPNKVFVCAQVRACEHVNHSPSLFSAPQCLGYRNERGKATHEMCFPSKELIIKQIKRHLRKLSNKATSLFVASDSNHMLSDLEEALKRQEVCITCILLLNLLASTCN